tara:strand:+ start:1312 stop:1809 length:498 start_codon:yes stop_codon:yes gene_type:complete
MTTIRLIPQVMEFDVAIDVASMPSLFDQSLETTICEKIDEHVTNRIPDAESVAEALENSSDFLRRIRDWAIESIDFGDIAQRSAEFIDSEMLENALCTDRFVRVLTDTTRFRNVVRGAVDTYMTNVNIMSLVQDAVNTAMLNVVNDAAERSVALIQGRLNARSDV